MIDAERRLLGNALLDFSNKRFVLLSESCIPLFNFTTIYSYLLASNLSFLGSFDDPGPHGLGRYSPQMLPLIEASHWRKGAQWFELHRELAILVVSDRTYYPLFRDFCQQSCYSDEHYLQTLVNIRYGAMSANRPVTWVDWSAGGAHPEAFECDDVSDELLNRIRFGSGQCELNGVATSMCFLFARKFSPEALEPLLKVAPLLLGFDQ